MEQHALAQAEGPRGELLGGFPTLREARDDVALMIDISQAGIYHAGGMGNVLLIMTMRVEAGRVAGEP